MYDSPITIYEDMQEQIVKEKDGAIFKAIMKYDIHVDKDELIKALAYDRNQYEKGYKDGIAVLDKIIMEIEEKWETMHFPHTPSAMAFLYAVEGIVNKYREGEEE